MHSRNIRWGNQRLEVEFDLGTDGGPHLTSVRMGDQSFLLRSGLPLVDVLAVSAGHSLASGRLTHTVLGEELRYVRHAIVTDSRSTELTIELAAQSLALSVELHLRAPKNIGVFQSWVKLTNVGRPSIILQSVTSWSSYLGKGQDGVNSADDWMLSYADSEWLAEGRWVDRSLRDSVSPDISSSLTGHDPRGSFSIASHGSWSTGEHSTTAAIHSPSRQLAWVWQIEHSGAWRWEVGEDRADAYLALSGPTEIDHQWVKDLRSDESFTSIPVAVGCGRDLESALEEMTKYRRVSRRRHADSEQLLPIYNDYMNTLNGDATTEKLLPLVGSAAKAGAKIFCIDAGWYDDNHDWWDSVGEWAPSSTRFRKGLSEVTDRIHESGMIAGLWLEPEVIGTRAAVARQLPDSAFLQRHGQRVVEQGRFHLDMRSSAARTHLDSVIDRLIERFGIGYFKFDYNISAGSGTDLGADSTGGGLLEHNRAHLAWIDSVLDHYPELILENCASGAMRADFSLLSRMQLQSTSDQQDFKKYPPIAAAAPATILPEQAGNWSYPSAGMTAEETAFTLATSVLGRFYLSGHLDELRKEQFELVQQAIASNAELRDIIRMGVPFWPLGLPRWSDAWISLGLRGRSEYAITVWSREGGGEAVLHLPDSLNRAITVDTIFPRGLADWQIRWEPSSGSLHLSNTTHDVSARVFIVRFHDHDSI